MTVSSGGCADAISPDSVVADDVSSLWSIPTTSTTCCIGPASNTSNPGYEPVRAGAGINLLTDEGDSWAAHRSVLNPTFARRHLNEIVDLMIEPIKNVVAALPAGVEFDMHEAMVEATLRVVANTLFSQDFGPLVHSMHDLATRGLRHAEKMERLGLWGCCRHPCTTD